MSTAPSFWHQRTVHRLSVYVAAPIEERGVAIGVGSLVGVIMPGADPVQPDFLLIRTERVAIIAEDGRVRGVPDLLVEVLSPNNPEYDLVTKRAAYARAGVPEYWIVRPATHDVLLCTQPEAALGDFTAVQLFGSDTELV